MYIIRPGKLSPVRRMLSAGWGRSSVRPPPNAELCSVIKKRRKQSKMKNTMKRVLSFVLAAAMILSCCTGLSTKAVAAENDTVTITVTE